MSVVANFNELLANLHGVQERAAGRLSDEEVAAITRRLDKLWAKMTPEEQDAMIAAALVRRILARTGA